MNIRGYNSQLSLDEMVSHPSPSPCPVPSVGSYEGNDISSRLSRDKELGLLNDPRLNESVYVIQTMVKS